MEKPEVVEQIEPAVGVAPELGSTTRLALMEMRREALYPATFEEFQQALSKALIHFELTEEYRSPIASEWNLLRVREGYPAL